MSTSCTCPTDRNRQNQNYESQNDLVNVAEHKLGNEPLISMTNYKGL
jgi:hypothetical protein